MGIVLQKWGSGMGIRIPKVVLDLLHWTNKEALSLNVRGDKIIIEQTDKRKTVQGLFAGYEGGYGSDLG